jgi:phosphoserine phosphatase RsbU/P
MPGWDVLVADDEPVSRLLMSVMLKRAGFTAVHASDGEEALAMLSADQAPQLALLDWMMPRMDGIEVLRRLRTVPSNTPPYVMLVTARDATQDIVVGLEAGANDYVAKPVIEAEIVARLAVGVRVVELQRALADRVRHLEEALGNVKALQRLLPICAYCKAIKNDEHYWQQVEGYLREHAGLQFTHSYCPTCYDRHVRPQLEGLNPR